MNTITNNLHALACAALISPVLALVVQVTIQTLTA